MPSFGSILLASALVAKSVSGFDSAIVGTWTSKSASVLTGPSFYNPVNDSLIEPDHTGISYSFTSDGYYEESYYRAISNPAKPACPSAIMQWQHGSYELHDNGSMTLTPIAVDGRQLQSVPCNATHSSYTRYNQSEYIEMYRVEEDNYKKVQRLTLFQWDGTPIIPLYLAYSPTPMMLPTTTLNPTSKSKSTSSSKAKRDISEDEEEEEIPLNINAKHIKRGLVDEKTIDAGLLWWTGIGMTVFGGVAYML